MLKYTKAMNRVYVNRTLNMRQIQAIGFDMDHTLIQYNKYEYEKATHQVILQKLVQEKNYSDILLNLAFDFKKVIRGLVVDTKKGNLLKISRYRSIRSLYHGETQIDYNSRRKVYPSDYVDIGKEHLVLAESHYSAGSTLAFMQIIELKKTHKNLPSYEEIFNDIKKVQSAIHETNIIKEKVFKNPEKFIQKNPQTAPLLEKFLQHGKKLFLLTNSDIHYSSFLMNYTLQPFLKKTSHWKDLFEFVITSAHKPLFFYHDKKFEKLDSQTFEPLQENEDSNIYQYGNAQKLTQTLNLKEHEILYIGDEVYSDVVILKQKCGWRTALVISELESEQKIRKLNDPLYEEVKQLMKTKVPIEKKINQLASEQIENRHRKHQVEISNLLKETEELDKKLGQKITQINGAYNPLWGELMRVGLEESLFASQAERFSCIYMACISDFLLQSPRTYYRCQKRLFPHEM